VLAAALGVVAGWVCAPALAAKTRKLVGAFGVLNNPQGLAVDQSSGDVYVADTANHRIMKFTATGELLLGFGGNVGGLGEDVCGGLVACGPGTPGTAAGEFMSAEFIAIDEDPSSPSFHDVYVADTGDQLISKYTPEGQLVASWGNNGAGASANGQLNGTGTTVGSFGSLAGIAVDTTGTLNVMGVEHLENNVEVTKVFKFNQDGTFESELTVPRSTEPRGLAVNGAGNFFKVPASGSVFEVNPAGEEIGFVSEGQSARPGASAFAVEPETGDLYVVTLDERIDHYVFNGAGEVLEPDGSTCVPAPASEPACGASDSVQVGFVGSGVAVRSVAGDVGNVFVSNPVTNQVDVYELVTVPTVTSEAASEVGATSVRLNGTVEPEGIALSECVFEYVPQGQFEEEEFTGVTAQEQAPCSEPSVAEVPTSGETKVHANVTGLAPGTTYHYRLRAANTNQLPSFGAAVEFSTPPPPAIVSAVAENLSGGMVDLTVRIDPRGFQTSYRFEYGTSTGAEGVPAGGEGTITAAEGLSIRSVHITGLKSDTSYHWRVIATSVNGATASPDHSFLYPTGGVGLPDGRAYEMVTPPQKNGALIGDVFFASSIGGIRVSPAGTTVAAPSIQCFANAQSCNGESDDIIGSPYFFTRTPAGWVTSALSLPATEFSFSAEFGPPNVQAESALFASPGEPSGEEDLYLSTEGGAPVRIGPITPPADGALGLVKSGASADRAQAESADLSHVAWESESPGRWPLDETQTGNPSVYEYASVGGNYPEHPLLVGVSGGEGSTSLISTCGTELGDSGASPGMMSADGRVVYFTALGGAGCVGSGANNKIPVAANALYARVDGEGADAHTVAVSARSGSECTGGCLSSPAGAAEFVAASGDGSRVFFESTQQLTNQASQDSNGKDTAVERGCKSTVGVGGCNLYLYDLGAPAGRGLVDVSAGDFSGGGPRVRGVVAVSEDGSHVYFVAGGVLTGAPNAEGQFARSGANNLYVFERDGAFPGGRVAFIASLPVSDQVEWAVVGAPGNVSPDGRVLVFVSYGDLTADDTSVSGAQQVFRYDAGSGSHPPTLVRISVGEEGFNDNGNRSTQTPCTPGAQCSEDASIVRVLGGVGRRDPSMSDDGSFVFFQSPVGLTAGAPDDVRIGTAEDGLPIYAQNVYEWHEGHVSLISDGRDLSENLGGANGCVQSSVCLFGTDASGHDVFFATADQLAGTDTNTELDIYDARVCEPASPCIPEPPAPAQPCSGEECHGTPVATPGVPAAPTATFNGAGNAEPAPLVTKTVTKKPVKCKKHFTKNRKGKCVRAKSRKKGKKN